MMAFVVDGVLSIGSVWPHSVGQKFKLRQTGPAFNSSAMTPVVSLHLLQEDEISAVPLDGLFHLMEHEAQISCAEPLVHVE